MKLPKVPDFLKIPEDNELTYSQRELDALKIDTLAQSLIYRSASGYGNYKKTLSDFEKMLKTPLSEESFNYRHDFFSHITQNLNFKKGVEKIVKNLPRSNAIVRDEYRGEFSLDYLEAQRLLEVPESLSQLNKLFKGTFLSKDFEEMYDSFYLENKDFVSLTEDVLKNHPINIWEVKNRKVYGGKIRKIRTKEKNHENHDYVLEKIFPYQSASNFGRELREQFLTYLMFGRVLEKGAIPEVHFNNLAQGEIEQGIHLKYNSTSREYKRNSKFGSAVPNHASWNDDSRLTLITGPNSGGKSVYLRTIGLNTLLAMNGFNVFADKMELSPVRRIWPAFDFGDEKGAGHLETGLKYFRNMAENATKDDLLLMDEPAQGAEPAAEYELAKGNISKIAYLGGFNSFIVTHDIDMMREFEGKDGVVFKRVADYDDEENKYKIMDGLATGGYGMRLAKKIGADPESLEKLILERKKKGEL